jgi:transposase
VYGTICWVENAKEPTIEAELRPRANSQPICSECGHKRPGYDRLPIRRFEFIPMWGIKVFFLYAPRRVDCPTCGIRVERMPWSAGKHRLTETYAWFLAGWARRLSWKEVAEAFRSTWDHVFHSVEMAVTWGREHRDLTGIEGHWYR